MYKISFLMGEEYQKKLFSKAVMEKISELGDITLFKGEGSPTVKDARKLAANADIVITSWKSPKLDEEALADAGGLKLLLHAAGSVKGIVSEALWQKGIRVSNSAKPLGRGVAETALMFTIASLKNVWQLSEDLKQGKWNEHRDNVREVSGLTIGVIGAGNAGLHYISLMSNFDVDIVLYDPVVSEEKAASYGVRKVSLEELLRTSDVVSIHAPSIPETNKMLNADTLRLMKDDAVLINTARGSIIDEPALISELERGRFFACLDVTDPEPCAADHPFRSLPNVILTPHIAGAVTNGLYRIGNHVYNEILLFSENKELVSEIKKEDLGFIG